MKAHIVGGGFGGLAAAALLIQNADMPVRTLRFTRQTRSLAAGSFWLAMRKAATTCLARSSIGSSAALWICSQRSPLKLIPISMLQSNSSLSIKNTRLSTKPISSIGTSAACMTRGMG